MSTWARDSQAPRKLELPINRDNTAEPGCRWSSRIQRLSCLFLKPWEPPVAMSYPQFGYPYSSAPQFLMATNSLTTCCETSGRTLTDSGAAASAQTPVYCPVYESRLLATARHELNSAAALGVYGNPYTNTQGYGNYVTYGTEASAFYSLNSFDAKDGSGSAHAGITQAAAYYPYDHTLSQYQYDRYSTMDGGTRRKNATRETTSTLKAWLQEHRKNPYPTKGEKIMLAIITKMTLTQVSTWFANARRRLKKENKMTWAPRNKSEDEDEDLEGDGGGIRSKEESSDKVRDSNETSAEDEGISLQVDSLTDHSCSAESDGEKVPCRVGDPLCESGSECKDKYEEIEDDDVEDDVEEDDEEDEEEVDRGLQAKPVTSSPLTGVEAPLLGHPHGEDSARNANKAALDARIPQSAASQTTQASKPKLWSLAEIATSDLKHPHHHHQHHHHHHPHHHSLGQSCPPSASPSSTPHSAAYSPSSLLGRHIYYTSPFYSNYTNYGNFNALQGQGILRYNSAAAMASSEGLGQTVLSGGGGSALKQGSENSLKPLASHLEQHYKASSSDSKKDPTEVCTVGVQPYL